MDYDILRKAKIHKKWKGENTMKAVNVHRLWKGIFTAAVLSCLLAVPASAKEERTPVGRITLNFSADIQAGDSEAYIDVSVEDGSCSVESADFVNEQEYWAGGVRPKVEIWLEADSDCYFKKSGKSAFTFTGDDVKYVSSSTKYDREMMRLVVTLDKLDEEDEDLEVSELIWDEDNAIAHWDQNGIAKKYKVRLCRGRGGSSTEDGVGSVHTVTENSFDFAEQIPKAGNYYFKVRAVDIRDNLGDWEESPWFEVTEEDLSEWKGSWKQNERGWWYENRDGSWLKECWQMIDSDWYFFDSEGYMKTGWIDWNGKSYFCSESGAMLVSCTTPDGYSVGEDGAKILP